MLRPYGDDRAGKRPRMLETVCMLNIIKLVVLVLIACQPAAGAARGGNEMDTVRDHLWIWCHEAGSNNGFFGLSGESRMTPAEAAFYMDVPNLIMVVFGGKPEPPFDKLAVSMRPLKRVVWSIVGDSSSTRNNKATDLDEVISLAGKFPNISGGIMDDFFHASDANGSISRYGADDIGGFRKRLHDAPHKLDLWVVLYKHDLDLPVKPYVINCDVVTFWTWTAAELRDLPKNFERMESVVGPKRKVLGCYMWDFGTGKPMPVELMKLQCEKGLQWLKEGRIDGMIFLSSVVCDLDLETVEWTRKWIAQVGDQPLRGKRVPAEK